MVKVNKLIFIMTDTWRQDHFGLYGNKIIRTPNIDRFSNKCVVFDRCYANSYATGPARADIFTGKYTYAQPKWRERRETILSQILQRKKYTTAAVGDFLLYKQGFENFIFIRGQHESRDVRFERVYESDYSSPKTMISASKWLERHYKENHFLYVETWDPHEPWHVPQWYTEHYYPGYDGKYYLAPYWFYKEAGLTEEDVKKTHAIYCAEITMVDRWVGHLLDSIEAMNLMDETAIIFTSDHGFYFGEHGMFGKNMFPFPQNFRTSKKPPRHRYRSPLYEEIAHVPLLIYLPGVKARRVDEIVGLADLMPTVLELMGVEIPKTVESKSLVPLMMGEDQKWRDFAVTSSGLRNLTETEGQVNPQDPGSKILLKDWPPSTVTTREWSLLYAAEGQLAELYHLPSDPKEEKNIIKEEPAVAQDLLNKFVRQLEESGTEPHLLNPRRRF